MRHDDIAKVLALKSRLPGVSVGEIEANQADLGYSAWIKINDVHFRAYIQDHVLRKQAGSTAEMMEAVAAPARALDKLYRDGIAEGRKRERDDEIKRLSDEVRSLHQGVIKSRTAKIYAAGWNATAKSLGEANAK